jgi:hypothetical protein
LLDDTKLPDSLSAYEVIDFRNTAYHKSTVYDFHWNMRRVADRQFQEMETSKDLAKRYYSSKRRNYTTLLLSLFVGIVLVSFLFINFHSTTLLTIQSYFRYIVMALIFIIIFLGILALVLVLWLNKNDKIQKQKKVDYTNDPAYVERQIERMRDVLQSGEWNFVNFVAEALAVKIPVYKK